MRLLESSWSDPSAVCRIVMATECTIKVIEGAVQKQKLSVKLGLHRKHPSTSAKRSVEDGDFQRNRDHLTGIRPTGTVVSWGIYLS